MLNNSSSSSNDFSIVSIERCFMSSPSIEIFVSYFFVFLITVLPLCIFILYLGLQQWRHQRSTSTASMMSHSDSFTYHLVTMELIYVVGCTLCCCGIFGNIEKLVWVGNLLSTLTWYGETFFHILTCMERYMAVVHPITYLSLRGGRGLRIRYICIVCVWLLSAVGISLIELGTVSLLMDFYLLAFTLVIIFFCSLSILCVLIRPGPGGQGGDRERVDQSKQRAFYTILAISGVLLISCAWNLVWVTFTLANHSGWCLALTFQVWFNFPSSLVLPLLYLKRARLSGRSKNNIK